MRELRESEIENVSGGVLGLGAAIGGVVGGVSAYTSGGGVGDVIAGVAFGAVSGFFGGIATSGVRMSGFARGAFATYAVETATVGSLATSQDVGS